MGHCLKTWTLKMITNAQERLEANHCVESYGKMVNQVHGIAAVYGIAESVQ